MITNAEADLIAQASPNQDYDAEDALLARYETAAGRKGTLRIADFDRNPSQITEMDALIAYLQMTGTLVDFSVYEADDLNNRR
jgi:cytochrome c oxidase cbb3-type subunit 2